MTGPTLSLVTSRKEKPMSDGCSDLISHLHWTNGGTALTNFDSKDLPKFLEAIKAHGDDDMVVVLAPMDKPGAIPTDFSLHCLSMPANRDCYPRRSQEWGTGRSESRPHERFDCQPGRDGRLLCTDWFGDWSKYTLDNAN